MSNCSKGWRNLPVMFLAAGGLAYGATIQNFVIVNSSSLSTGHIQDRYGSTPVRSVPVQAMSSSRSHPLTCS